MESDLLFARSIDDWADSEATRLLHPREDDHLKHFSNFSTFAYDAQISELRPEETGCFARGVNPFPLNLTYVCYPGWYCEHADDEHPAQFCPPTPECAIQRANKITCGPQGFLEPQVCSNGYYCPPGGKQMLPCPAGTFCPTGSREPFKCAWGAICPAQSDKETLIAPLIGVIILDIVLLLLVLAGWGISRWRRRHHKRYTTLDTDDKHGDNIELLNAAAMPGRNNASPRPSFQVTDTSYEAAYVPEAASRAYSPNGGYRPYAPPGSDRPNVAELEADEKASIHRRRASGRVDNMDGFIDDDAASTFDEEFDDDFHNSPDFQRFIRSMSKTIETNSIGLTFDFENLNFKTKKGKKILEDVTGSMPRGSFWGIMGGSGAGKTTFVNTLMGKQHTTSGTIKINGWQKDMSKYKKLIGYVPQDDIIFPELTVRENILHSARCRLPRRWRDAAIQDHVDSLIACLQLTHVQHSRVGDSRKPVISGGQRKRVNIGIELAAAPMAIFLDEPTSGLDATSASSIIRLLRALSRLGVTTIAIIHQPREQIFAAFDNILVLAQGRSVYCGPTQEMQGYFENLGFAFPQRGNPADTLIDIATGDGARYTVGAGKQDTDVQTLIDAWHTRGQYAAHQKHLSVDDAEARAKRNRRISNQSLNSTHEQEESLNRTMKARGATWPAQMMYCFYRAMVQQVRNSTSFFFEIGVGALAGVVIGLSAFASGGHLFQGIYHGSFAFLSSAVDYQSTPQIGLLGAMAIGLAASAPGFWVFGEEKMMYYRETAAGHSRSAYYIGKLLSTFMRIALSAFHFTVFLNILATPLIPFQLMYIADLLYFWCVYGLASIVSMLVKREDGPLIAVLASLIIGVLGGVAPPLKTVSGWHLEWFWRLSPGVWFTEAYFTENLTPLAYLYQIDLAAKFTGFTLSQFPLDMLMLFVIGLVYRIIAYPLLIFINRSKQR